MIEPVDEATSDASHELHGGVLVIRDLETLRLISDPLRLRLLELAREEPVTAKEMARRLGVSQTRLYYHLKLLEERGLLAVASTRLVSGIVEKRYRTTAYRLSVDKTLIGPTAQGSDALDTYLSVVLDEVRSEINRSVDAGLIDLEQIGADEIAPRRLVLGRNWGRLTPAQVAEFSRRQYELWRFLEDAEAEADGPDAQLYEALFAFYPTLTTGRSSAENAATEESAS
jgi:DNA-binding transcriptional ArsR family regulator